VTHPLFVYGTLAPGRPNERVLAGVPGTWTPATIRGQLFPHGWGAAAGFPGVVLDDQGPEVRGFLFRSARLAEHWQRLDDFEGDGYKRVLVTARLADGESAVAFVYVLSEVPPDR
jgi:gamma-glutamylcyclotransferase (GGCT)/AIG2-like uncharacterized protein YtfP